MKTKSLSIKVPIEVALKMSDDGTLNPMRLGEILLLNMNNPVYDQVKGISMNYTFKIDATLHKIIKLKAIELDLPINEFVCRLLNEYYRKKGVSL